MTSSSLRLYAAAAAALFLGACASQNPAPVVDGTSATTSGTYGSDTAYTPSGDTSNPYGATPYDPNATAADSGVYVPPAESTYVPPAATVNNGTYVPAGSGGTYVGNYAPVDRNATHHRVVAGDTVYNISKRYGISQDSLRAWNNLSGNTISIGQTLRVKASGNSGIGNSGSGSVSGGQTHRVEAGDTVYNIAKRYGISQETLRSLNGLSGNDIRIGQVLRISSRSGGGSNVAAAPATVYTPPPVQTPPTVVSTPVVSTAPVTASTPAVSTTPAVTQTATFNHNGIVWQSPLASATVSKAFTTVARNMELSGRPGQNVLAAADGQVIFSGTGPRGYGNLVVIQHSPQYLTAYGNNERLLVKDMQRVSRGQSLASLGSNGKMTFEVREDGKPVNPGGFIRF